jgi:hypothetical protein
VRECRRAGRPATKTTLAESAYRSGCVSVDAPRNPGSNDRIWLIDHIVFGIAAATQHQPLNA